ncbi:MAG: hypothetical protein ACRDH6_03890 [Actinomycetota bacterium]
MKKRLAGAMVVGVVAVVAALTALGSSTKAKPPPPAPTYSNKTIAGTWGMLLNVYAGGAVAAVGGTNLAVITFDADGGCEGTFRASQADGGTTNGIVSCSYEVQESGLGTIFLVLESTDPVEVDAEFLLVGKGDEMYVMESTPGFLGDGVGKRQTPGR